MIETRVIETSVHGRCLVRSGPSHRLLVGFHGYAENAEKHLADLEMLPGVGDWTVIAIQALHPFHVRRTPEVVASWMTRLDREHAIADNIAYVRRVLDGFPDAHTVVFAGFSQGAAMAWRAAAAIRCNGVIALGEHVPGEFNETTTLPPALLGRGSADEWYTDEKFKKDLRFLEGRKDVTVCRFEGGHEWTDEFRQAAGEFLRRFV